MHLFAERPGSLRHLDLDAFERVYREHVSRIYALALRMSGDAGRAEDLTQEVFLRAWRKQHTLRNGCALSAWLRTLAVNLIVSRNRTHFRRACREVELKEIPAPGESGVAGGTETRMDLESAIASLPPRARAILVLHDVEGYTHEEIGRMLRIATGTSKAQLHRARLLVRSEVNR